MTYKFIFFILLFNSQLVTLLAQPKTILQASTCLGNCLNCLSLKPSVCLDADWKVSDEPLCLSFFKGSNCSQRTFAYENINEFKQFSDWNLNLTTSCSLMPLNPKDKTYQVYTGKGPINVLQTLSRRIFISNTAPSNRAIIQLSVAVQDPTSLAYFQSLKNKSSLQQSGKKFLVIELNDDTNTTIERYQLNYNVQSKVKTSCGYIYTYQLAFDLKKQYTGFVVYLSFIKTLQNTQQQSTWTLINLAFSIGCRGFVATSNANGSYNCDACISGDYPVYSRTSSWVQQCRACDFRCKVCSATQCLTCVQNTQFKAETGTCELLQFFQALGPYKIVTGIRVKVLNYYESQYIRSQRGVVQIQQPLKSKQSYTVYFDMLYSQLFKQTGQKVQVSINDHKFNFQSSTLPIFVASKIPEISHSSQQIFKLRLAYTINEVQQQASTSNIYLKSSELKISAANSEFAISNINFVQFQCTKNCQDCKYSQLTQTSQCTKCAYFFDRDSNCLNCANGFFLAVNNDFDLCIKCHSTCKQCSGPQSTDCLSCFDGFTLGQFTYDFDCINCLYLANKNTSSNQIPQCVRSPQCLQNHPLSKLSANSFCQQCFQTPIDQLGSSNFCDKCWLQLSLLKSSCEPVQEQGYQTYGSDLSNGVISNQWKSNKVLRATTWNNYYSGLFGVEYTNRTTNQQTTMVFTEQSLPSHQGFIVLFNIFKVNSWNEDQFGANSLVNHTINIVIRSQQTIIINKTINVNNSHGSNIFGGFGSGNQMIYTFIGSKRQHNLTGRFQIIIRSTHDGIFLKDLNIYLGNCEECRSKKINYQLYYIPKYSSNQSLTGLDVWLTFSQQLSFVVRDQLTQNTIINSFMFSIDSQNYRNLLPFEVVSNQIKNWNYVKYFIPLNQSLIDATLRANNSMSSQIYFKVSNQSSLNSLQTKINGRNLLNLNLNNQKRLLLNEKLEPLNVQTKIHRFEYIAMDERKTMESVGQFYKFFQWFTLFAMIILAFFGFGVIFEEFSILVQLLFLHIYISTDVLPASFKEPLSHLQKMQNLNYFAYSHAESIENGWFSSIHQQSPYPFTQYGKDIYFARSFYAIIIINIVYLSWFIILFIAQKKIKPFKTSPSKVAKFFRDIPKRPMNYFDQIWRYQFITVMWACFIQFHNFDGSTAEMKVNLVLCVASFVISLIWPAFVMVYTYYQHLVINIQHFLYLYNDIYYRRISSIAQRTSYYLYIAIRFGRYFIFALFIAVFVFQTVIGSIVLVAITILETVFIIKFSIFRDKVYFVFKLIQNLGFITLEILLLIVYGYSDEQITNEGFISLGFGLNALYILMIVNGVFRFLYIGYQKIKEFKSGKYDYGEQGELQNYDNYDNKKFKPGDLPPTERTLI